MVCYIDYDAPLSENGDTTEKYNVIRDAIAKYKGEAWWKGGATGSIALDNQNVKWFAYIVS